MVDRQNVQFPIFPQSLDSSRWYVMSEAGNCREVHAQLFNDNLMLALGKLAIWLQFDLIALQLFQDHYESVPFRFREIKYR